jgi:ATP-dependent DNA ligase
MAARKVRLLTRNVSKRADASYAPGNRGLWLKVKCLNREEFVVVGWSDPEGRRPLLGALLLAYYDSDDRLVYAGRVGSGINDAKLARLCIACSPWRFRRCRSKSRRRAPTVSVRHWCSAACTGCGRS